MEPDSTNDRVLARTLLAAVIGAALLPGCGGGFAEDVAGAVACGLLNCKPSAEVANADLTLAVEVLQRGAAVTVTVQPGYRSNLLTVVQLGPGEVLSAEADGRNWPLQPADSILSTWRATIAPAAAAQPEVAVLLRRANGSQHRATVRVPAPFSWLGGPAQWSGRSGTVDQVLDLPAAEPVQVLLRGLRCDRSDAQVFERASVTELGVQPAPVADIRGSLHRVDLPRLAAALEGAALQDAPAGTSVLGCRFELTWARVQAGTRAPTPSAQGRIEGRYEQGVAVSWRW